MSILELKTKFNVVKCTNGQTLLFMQGKDSLLSVPGEELGSAAHELLALDSQLYDRQNNSA